MDTEPPIRANTTILLGNLAPHLGEATQKRVLLNAFTRALKDGFPPARIAGIRVSPGHLYCLKALRSGVDCMHAPAQHAMCASQQPSSSLYAVWSFVLGIITIKANILIK